MPKGGRRSTSWKRGQSGNRSGRPRRPAKVEAHKIIADVKAAARELTPQALETLQEVMENKRAPPAARVSAATAILDRGWGRPTETVKAQVGLDLVWLLRRGKEIHEAKMIEGKADEVKDKRYYDARS